MDYKAFWEALAPESRRELLKHAPKVASPWAMTKPCDCGCGQKGPTNVYHRRVMASGGSWMLASVRPNEDGSLKWRATTWGCEWVHALGYHDTLEEAQAACDAQLVLEGWELCS